MFQICNENAHGLAVSKIGGEGYIWEEDDWIPERPHGKEKVYILKNTLYPSMKILHEDERKISLWCLRGRWWESQRVSPFPHGREKVYNLQNSPQKYANVKWGGKEDIFMESSRKVGGIKKKVYILQNCPYKYTNIHPAQTNPPQKLIKPGLDSLSFENGSFHEGKLWKAC